MKTSLDESLFFVFIHIVPKKTLTRRIRVKKIALMVGLFFLFFAFLCNAIAEAKTNKKTYHKVSSKSGKPIRHEKRINPLPKIDRPVKTGDSLAVKITAYYGPKPNQGFYYKGSFEADLKLNGSGIQTASGKPPNKELVSADPRLFPLGSILMIPGFGKVTVADTGKAIKGARIDVFAGHGEKALRKALRINHQVEVTVIYLAQN